MRSFTSPFPHSEPSSLTLPVWYWAEESNPGAFFMQYSLPLSHALIPEVSNQTAGLSDLKRWIVLNHQAHVGCVTSAWEINIVKKKSLPQGLVFRVLFYSKRNEYMSETSKDKHNGSVGVLR